MKIHRFIGNFNIKENLITTSEKELVHQMFRVLKLEEGEKVTLSDGLGLENLYTIKSISKNEVVFETNEKPQISKEAPVEVTLFMAILKKENFETVVEKATEVGVAKIVPILTDRTIKQNINMERLQKIAREASEQCGRAKLPIIEPVASLDEILKLGASFDEAWILEIGKKESKENKEIKTRAIIVGPEGGFTKEEIEKAVNNGWKLVGLSNLTFRGETAGIIGSYLATRTT